MSSRPVQRCSRFRPDRAGPVRADEGRLAVGRVREQHRKNDEFPELADREFARAMPRSQRERILKGQLAGGDDVAALRRFAGLTQVQFSREPGISAHTLRNWEEGRHKPVGPALALLRIAARHPRVLEENLAATA